MPLAVLLNPDDPIFAWEHMNAHREYFAVMSALSRFSVLPYLLHPPHNTDVRAGDWHLNHQQSHNDYTAVLPAHWQSPAVGFGIPTVQNLVDSNLNDRESLTWWTFLNHQEHFITNEAILPLPLSFLATDTNAPGWWIEPGVGLVFHYLTPYW